VAPSELTLRPAHPGDADAVADVHLASRRAAAMPPGVHTDDEVRAWLAGRLGCDEVWLAEHDARPVGYARFTRTWLDDLYVLPPYAGHGVGTALLDVVKAQRPRGFALWVFEQNHPALAFYAARGLVELERTDGSANEERAPDIRMAWPGEEPLTYLRAEIDEVDAQLADLLHRRAALTRAVQPHRATALAAARTALAAADGSRPGVMPPDAADAAEAADAAVAQRDLDRERAIAAAMAQRAPSLGAERIARIVHVVITESLDAAAELSRR
jgi:GNAT superfamily N-acetyltransferase/chorismate mutase